MKYIPELTLFGISTIYLLLYILNDINLISVPNWVLKIDMTMLSLILMTILIFFKDRKKGEKNEKI